MAITTGTIKEIVEKTLKNNEISSFFDIIVTGEDFIKSKPFPECYEKTLENLQLNPSETIIIEDSVAGVKAAKAAKCKVFGMMTYLENKDLLEADNIFTSHKDIENYFRKNLKNNKE
jgi:beta-phosphoglucomutase-like phosphatase (HAD superfamily)